MKQTLLFFSWLLIVVNCKAQHTIKVKHTYYTLEYDTILKSPLISWYIQTTAHATSTNKIDRKTVASFHQDPLINPKYQCANDGEYLNNWHWDKGHLSPYSAFYFDITAAKESMYYTNTSPQYSYFNEHSWEKLEQYILKTLSPKIDSIYVYTGVLYGSSKMKEVPIGDYYWKVIVYKGGVDCWIAPNIETKLTDYSSYHTTIDKLKAIILNYYPKIKLPF
jgi:DNA/RNA endonuclease G (NUC1)